MADEKKQEHDLLQWDEDELHICDSTGRSIHTVPEGLDEVAGKRLVACHNALRGIPIEDILSIHEGWKYLLIISPDHAVRPELLEGITKALNLLVKDKLIEEDKNDGH